MPINEAEFKKRKQEAEKARQTRDRAGGQLEATMERLRKDFDCDTVEEAEALATKLKRKATKAEAAYDKAAEEFEEAWGEHLED